MKTNMIDYSDEEDEIYEITDYSNSSPLENLSSKLENKISQWVKENQEFYSHSFEYSNTLELKLEFYNQDLEDMEDEKELSSVCKIFLNDENDFPSKSHNITKW